MRYALTLLIAILTLSAAHAVPKSKYTLYYLDKHRNVVAVGFNANAGIVVKSRQLTTGGGYQGYSVSPDGRQVFAWKQISPEDAPFPVFDCFLEKDGKLQGKILGKKLGDEFPTAVWLPGNNYLIVTISEQVEIDSIVYSIKRHRIIYDTEDQLTGFSSDQSYSFVLQDKGDEDNSPSWLRVLDMKTGKTTKVAQVNFGLMGDPVQSVWFGDSHRFAFIDIKGKLYTVGVGHDKSSPIITKTMLTKNGGCAALRYIPGKGIYFTQKIGKTTKIYCSKDLRTLNQTAVLPAARTAQPTFTERDGLVYSSDGKLHVDIKTGYSEEIGMITVNNISGGYVDVGMGRKPNWKNGKQN